MYSLTADYVQWTSEFVSEIKFNTMSRISGLTTLHDISCTSALPLVDKISYKVRCGLTISFEAVIHYNKLVRRKVLMNSVNHVAEHAICNFLLFLLKVLLPYMYWSLNSTSDIYVARAVRSYHMFLSMHGFSRLVLSSNENNNVDIAIVYCNFYRH